MLPDPFPYPLKLYPFQVGYHNEHHDFPQIPHTRLHKVRPALARWPRRAMLCPTLSTPHGCL